MSLRSGTPVGQGQVVSVASMTSTTGAGRSGTGRPLSPAVYWRRRLFVLGTVVALVLIVVNLVGGGSDSTGPGVTASNVGADQESAAPPAAPTAGPTAGTGKKKGTKERSPTTPEPTVVLPTAPPLAEPEGECVDDDIAVTPTVQRAVAGRSALITLKLRTISAEACTWQVSADTLAVRISTGDDEVWASRECPGALTEQSVVVRRAVTATYDLRWNTRRSDAGCPRLTEFAPAADYRVTAAAYGGEPADLVFDLVAPTAPEPAPAPEAEKLKDTSGKQDKQDKQSNQASGTAG